MQKKKYQNKENKIPQIYQLQAYGQTGKPTRTDSQENCVKHRQIFRADFPRGLSKRKELRKYFYILVKSWRTYFYT